MNIKFIKYILLSLTAFVVDILLYTLFKKVIGLSIIISTIIARIGSSLYNYFVNRRIVFDHNKNNSIYKYYLLVIFQMMMSGVIVDLLESIVRIESVCIKLIVDALIFIINYYVQKYWVFKNN